MLSTCLAAELRLKAGMVGVLLLLAANKDYISKLSKGGAVYKS